LFLNRRLKIVKIYYTCSNIDLSLTLYVNRDKLEKYTNYTEFDDDVETLYENRVISGLKDLLAGVSWTNKPAANKSITTRLFFQDFLSESGE
jgi:hypothetical protein